MPAAKSAVLNAIDLSTRSRPVKSNFKKAEEKKADEKPAEKKAGAKERRAKLYDHPRSSKKRGEE